MTQHTDDEHPDVEYPTAGMFQQPEKRTERTDEEISFAEYPPDERLARYLRRVDAEPKEDGDASREETTEPPAE